MKKYIVLSCVIASLLLVVLSVPKNETLDTQPFKSNMNGPEFQDYIQSNNPVVIDVRTPQEFTEGHINNSINLDFYAANFSSQLSDLDKKTPYAIYCRSGNRSGSTVQMMKSLGFTNVVELTGGMLAWERSGLKTCSTKLTC